MVLYPKTDNERYMSRCNHGHSTSKIKETKPQHVVASLLCPRGVDARTRPLIRFVWSGETNRSKVNFIIHSCECRE
jgi:hypothetical protein